MHVIEPMGGDDLYSVLVEAVERAPARFKFNDWTFETREGETLGDARQRFRDENNFEVLTPEESAERSRRWMEETKAKQANEIAAANAPTEAEMRDADTPSCERIEEIAAYITSLVERPHDYGTCVYAMSLAAVAAFNYVAHKLGVTGFQASCADLDVIRRTRRLKHGFKIVDFADLLYPQYESKIPGFWQLIDENREQLAKAARERLEEDANENAHPDVRKHWMRLSMAK